MFDSPYGVLQAFDGIKLRYGFWPVRTGRPSKTLVLLGGRSEFMEKYLVTVEALNARGFDVYSLDWRGQGLSDRMLPESEKGHVQSYSHYISDLALFLNQIVLPVCRQPLVVLGHSMGAHIALRYLSECPAIADQAIFTGPMIQIKMNPLTEMIARRLCRLMHLTSNGHVGMPSLLRKDSFARPFRHNWLTSDADRFYAIRRMLVSNPRLRVSDVTFGWLAATFESIDVLKVKGAAENIDTPILIVVAGGDRVVSNAATYRFARKLPVHRVENIQGAFHEILQERENYRRQFWQAFDSFVNN